MSSREYKYNVRFYNSCDCEIAIESCDTMEELQEIISSYLETLEDGDRFEFEVRN